MIALNLTGCGGRSDKKGPGSYVKVPVQQLIDEKGAPEMQGPSKLVAGAQILEYTQDEKFQVEKGLVEAEFRDPSDQERDLLYWQYKWEEQGQDDVQVRPLGNASHDQGLKEYYVPKLGETVIYDSQKAQVTRVMHHEPK